MARFSLVRALTLVCVIGVSPATAQSLRDIVKDSEGGRMPSQAEWQRRSAPGHQNAQTEAPPPNVPMPPASVPPPADSRRPTTATPICVPPGMPPLSDLVAVGHGVMIVPVEGTDRMVKVDAVGLVTKENLARYRAGGMPPDFIAYYVLGHLAAIDDHPGDSSQPDLVDTGMVSPRGAALAHGTPMCQWERLPGTPPLQQGAAMPGARI